MQVAVSRQSVHVQRGFALQCPWVRVPLAMSCYVVMKHNSDLANN